MKSPKRTTIFVVVVIAVALWCVPVAVNAMLVFGQYRQATGSLFLIEIGVLPYALALLIAAVGPPLLYRFHRENGALILAVMMLALWVPAALIWAVGMGSP